ncbi:MAG: sigma-70 family RNA polymerase sigma factor [Clostridiales bacterium]
MNIDDKNIIILYKKNNTKGFNLLYQNFNKHVYSICYRYTNSKEDSLDLTQEIFIKIYKSLNNFDKTKRIKPWINKITVNTCLNHICRTKKKKTESLDENIINKKIISNESTENKIMFFDTKNIIEEELEKMPELVKMVFILRHFNKLSYSEIASSMSLPLGTVKTNIYKARRILKDTLLKKGIWEV